jgi:hypothetical protein
MHVLDILEPSTCAFILVPVLASLTNYEVTTYSGSSNVSQFPVIQYLQRRNKLQRKTQREAILVMRTLKHNNYFHSVCRSVFDLMICVSLPPAIPNFASNCTQLQTIVDNCSQCHILKSIAPNCMQLHHIEINCIQLHAIASY